MINEFFADTVGYFSSDAVYVLVSSDMIMYKTVMQHTNGVMGSKYNMN